MTVVVQEELASRIYAVIHTRHTLLRLLLDCHINNGTFNAIWKRSTFLFFFEDEILVKFFV